MNMGIMAQEYPLSYRWLWLSLGLLVVLLVAFILPVVPFDYWWYLRLGRDVLASGSVPQVETYSYTRFGQPVVHPSWLSAVLLAILYDGGGLTLSFLARGVILSLAYSLLWVISCQQCGPRLASFLMLLSALAGSNNWSFRPQLFTYLLFALVFWSLWQWNEQKKNTLWLLPVCGVLWVNLHGSFPMLFALCALFFVFGNGLRKHLLLWTVLALIATLINPRGINAWTHVAFMMRNPSIQMYSAEWVASSNIGWQMNIFYAWLVAFPLLALFSNKRPTWLEWSLYLSFGVLAIVGIRYVIWFLFIIAPLTSRILPPVLQKLLDPPPAQVQSRTNYAVSFIILATSLLSLPGPRQAWFSSLEIPLWYSTPVQAAAWLKMHPELPGPMWADLASSSYLIFALPERPVWIDTRFEVYPPEQWKEYLIMEEASLEGQRLFDRYGINLLFFQKEAGQSVENLRAAPQWCPQYEDDAAIIFTRCSK
ncbi:MAG: hypothetical protein N2117_12450 [Anaerolineales bacterium]|nr:hypothetical protein [Anaerolineales bacterium]MCX7756034.1 hypothetical protein [Anaerolineales bacterium]MDW8277042.1 hypothetical protein [Anaerolineales bacterium]